MMFRRLFSLVPPLLMMTSIGLAKSWQLEKTTTNTEKGPVDITMLTVTERDHGEDVALRVGCRADGVVSASLRLSKPTESEDVIATATARYVPVLIDFPRERPTRIFLRSTLGDRLLHFDDPSTQMADPENELLDLERWTVEKLVRRLASSSKITFGVSIDGSQDFQESFNIAGFRELAAPLANQCPKLGEWLSR